MHIAYGSSLTTYICDVSSATGMYKKDVEYGALSD
jgi:hypothetical protein